MQTFALIAPPPPLDIVNVARCSFEECLEVGPVELRGGDFTSAGKLVGAFGRARGFMAAIRENDVDIDDDDDDDNDRRQRERDV